MKIQMIFSDIFSIFFIENIYSFGEQNNFQTGCNKKSSRLLKRNLPSERGGDI